MLVGIGVDWIVLCWCWFWFVFELVYVDGSVGCGDCFVLFV